MNRLCVPGRLNWLALLAIALAPRASATTYTVGGPLGVHPTIQAAIDAALLAGGANDVAVHTGT